MTTMGTTYTFVANTRALAEQVNQDFSDVMGWIGADHHNQFLYTNAVPITVSGLAPGIILTQSGMISQLALQRITQPGIIDPNAVPSVSTVFGDGSDGSVTISSPTTLTRDMYYINLTVNSTLTTNGYRIYVQGTLSGTGTITYGVMGNGGNGQNSIASNNPGTGGTAGTVPSGAGYFAATAGQIGGPGSTASSLGGTGISYSHSISANNGAAGGGGGEDGGGGTTSFAAAGTATPVVQRFGIYKFLTFAGLDLDFTGAMAQIHGTPGSSGGSGGGYSAGGSAAGGGGSGATPGIIWIAARVWAGSFTISAIGGNGGTGGNGTTTNFAPGGGGAGGSGGCTITIYNQKTWTGSYNLSGGTGGSPGTGTGTYGIPAAGANGNPGTSYEIQVSNLI